MVLIHMYMSSMRLEPARQMAGRCKKPAFSIPAEKPELIHINHSRIPKDETTGIYMRILEEILTEPRPEIHLATVISEIKDPKLIDDVFTFRGYGGRAVDAIRDTVLWYTRSEDDFLRGNAYLALLKTFRTPEMFDFFMHAFERAAELSEREACFIVRGIYKLAGNAPKKRKAALERVLDALDCGSPGVQKEIILQTIMEHGKDDGVAMLIAKIMADPQSRGIVSCAFPEFADTATLINDPELVGYLAAIFKNNNIDWRTTFIHIIPKIVPIEMFASMFTRKEQVGLLGAPLGLLTINAELGMEYFRAACEGRLVPCEAMGAKFKYSLLPLRKLRWAGRVNLNAISVAEEVPEHLRLIVAYHEYVEGLTGSHRTARVKENKLADTLGLRNEMRTWQRFAIAD